MASLFRSPLEDDSDKDSSVEEVSNDTESVNRNTRPSADDVLQTSLSGSLSRLGGPGLPNIEAGQHSILFYLSLIEGRCRTQATNSLNKGRAPSELIPETHPEVHELARHLFREICKELHQAGILPDEYAGPNLENLRSQYLTSFDAILHNIASRRTDDPNPHRSVNGFDSHSVNRDTFALAFPGAIVRQQLQMANIPQPGVTFRLLGDGSIHQSSSSDYLSTYEEIVLLGKGGFGSVYKVRHRLAKNYDAVKKIVLPEDTVKSLNSTKGGAGKILFELETLASLSHQNVVVYRNSWIETVPAGIEAPGDGSSNSSSE
jgi:translation initiation factor 2-alpha kinase 3